MQRTRLLLLTLALAAVGPVAAQSTAEIDEQILKAAGLGTDDTALVQFFRQRSLKDNDRQALEQLVRQLDAEDYAARKEATDRIVQRGPVMLPLLKAALTEKATPELRLRAEKCMRSIEAAQGNDLVASAARLLAHRQPTEAVAVLLDFAPSVDDAWLLDEVLASLGRAAVKEGKVAPRLLEALHDPLPARRAAAVYVLGRRGDVSRRATVRAFLEDADPLLKQRAVEALVGKRPVQALKDSAAADATLLKTNHVPADAAGLLDFLRKRTLDANDQQRLTRLVRDLGSLSYIERHVAAQLLAKEGPAALAFLKPAEYDPDPEVARRAQRCVEEIRRGPGPALPIAAVRLLARPTADAAPDVASRALLKYVPFADDETVEEEVLNSLTLLSLRAAKLDPILTEALSDPLPARRAAAAYVLGHVGLEEHLPGLRKLLDDATPLVRLRAAQGLLAARDREAVPRLIAGLADAPPTLAWKLEETLHRLAGEQAPAESVGAATPEGRPKAVQAWQKWWQAHAATVDLARAHEGESYLGLVTVVEYDSQVGQLTGQVWEAPRNGPVRWKVGNLVGAMDAHVLPNGRVLVAENSAHRVTERDLDGQVRWEYQTPGGNPICCQRLPNGNTFIAMYNKVVEVRPDKSLVYDYSPGPQFYIFSAQKTSRGTVVCMTAQGKLLEIDPVARKEVRTVPLGIPAGGWCSVEALPNGHYLVATMNNSAIREVDADGKLHWTANYPGVFRATRLPNGNVLAVSMTTRKVAELDRAGTTRWERTCEGRPWNVHYR